MVSADPPMYPTPSSADRSEPGDDADPQDLEEWDAAPPRPMPSSAERSGVGDDAYPQNLAEWTDKHLALYIKNYRKVAHDSKDRAAIRFLWAEMLVPHPTTTLDPQSHLEKLPNEVRIMILELMPNFVDISSALSATRVFRDSWIAIAPSVTKELLSKVDWCPMLEYVKEDDASAFLAHPAGSQDPEEEHLSEKEVRSRGALALAIVLADYFDLEMQCVLQNKLRRERLPAVRNDPRKPRYMPFIDRIKILDSEVAFTRQPYPKGHHLVDIYLPEEMIEGVQWARGRGSALAFPTADSPDQRQWDAVYDDLEKMRMFAAEILATRVDEEQQSKRSRFRLFDTRMNAVKIDVETQHRAAERVLWDWAESNIKTSERVGPQSLEACAERPYDISKRSSYILGIGRQGLVVGPDIAP